MAGESGGCAAGVAAAPLVLLVRHGETAGNAAGRLQPPEEPLTATGRRQARRLGQALKTAETRGDFRVAAMLVSDLARTKGTAAGLLQALGPEGREVAQEPLLQERNFGDLRGQLYVDVSQEHGDFFAESFSPPGGETWAVFRARVDAAWAKVVATAVSMNQERLPGEAEPALVVVTHGLVLRAMADTHLALGDTSRQGNFGNTSVTAVRLVPGGDGRAAVERLNDTSHLAAAGAAGLPDAEGADDADVPLDDPLLRPAKDVVGEGKALGERRGCGSGGGAKL